MIKARGYERFCGPLVINNISIYLIANNQFGKEGIEKRKENQITFSRVSIYQSHETSPT